MIVVAVAFVVVHCVLELFLSENGGCFLVLEPERFVKVQGGVKYGMTRHHARGDGAVWFVKAQGGVNYGMTRHHARGDVSHYRLICHNNEPVVVS